MKNASAYTHKRRSVFLLARARLEHAVQASGDRSESMQTMAPNRAVVAA